MLKRHVSEPQLSNIDLGGGNSSILGVESMNIVTNGGERIFDRARDRGWDPGLTEEVQIRIAAVPRQYLP